MLFTCVIAFYRITGGSGEWSQDYIPAQDNNNLDARWLGKRGMSLSKGLCKSVKLFERKNPLKKEAVALKYGEMLSAIPLM